MTGKNIDTLFCKKYNKNQMFMGVYMEDVSIKKTLTLIFGKSD